MKTKLMKRKLMKRELMAMLLVVAVVALLASGCGQTGKSPVGSSETAQASESAQTSVTTQASEPVQTSASATTNESTQAGETTQAVEATTASVSVSPEAGTQSGNGTSDVFMTADISPEGLQAVYDALQWTPTGKLAVKVSTGEPPSSNYLRQELIGGFVTSLKGTYVECNTAYGGSRAETAMHYQVAKDHGFEPIDIMDEKDSMELSVGSGDVLGGVNYVGANFANYGSMLVLSHFKGHQMAGFGGAVKNISIGIGSSKGKVWIHSGGERTEGSIMGDVDKFQKGMAEAGLSVSDALGKGKNITYINVMNRLSIDCDCNGRPAEPDIHDIGILASHDPVALDQACLDLVWKAEGNESFVARVESKHGFLSLEHAEEIGLGSRTYQLVVIK